MSHNITVEGGTTVRLKTAGKYCDQDIVITATGSSGGEAVDIYDPEANPVEQGTIASSTLVDGNSATRLRVKGFIPVKANTPYRMSTNVGKVFVIQCTAEQKAIENSGWKTLPYVFITGSTCEYIRITLANTSNTAITTADFEWLKIEPFSIGTN